MKKKNIGDWRGKVNKSVEWTKITEQTKKHNYL